jgi:RNA polymerase sigma-70 factor (ECF subfamily)
MASTPEAPPKAPSNLNAEALQQLREDLVRFLTRRTSGDAALAEDLAQESLVHVLRGYPQFRGTAALRTWARRIAANVWRDHMRKLASNPVDRAAAGSAFSVAAILDALTPQRTAAGPELAPDRAATHNCLLGAVRQLPLNQRRVVLLHDFGDMPLEEVARVLGCSPGTAKVRLHRARRRVAETCRAECVPEVGLDGTTVCTPKPSSPPMNPNMPAAKTVDKRRR